MPLIRQRGASIDLTLGRSAYMAWTSRRRRFNATLLVRLPRRPGRCKGCRRAWNKMNFVSFHAHNFSAEFCARNNQGLASTCLVAVEAGFDKPSNTSTTKNPATGGTSHPAVSSTSILQDTSEPRQFRPAFPAPSRLPLSNKSSR